MTTMTAGARRLATDPLVPALAGAGTAVVLAAVALATGSWPAAGWAVLGGLAGYTLSGSV